MMQLLRSTRLGRISRRDAAGLALLLLLAVIWFVVSQRQGSAADRVASLERRLSTVQQQARTFREDVDLDALDLELQRLNEAPPAQPFPPREEAFDLGSVVFDKAATLGVTLMSFKSTDATTILGQSEFPSVNYSLRAEGHERGLTGMLSLLDEFPSSLMQSLGFKRRAGQWEMNMGLAVVYNDPARAVLPAPTEQEQG